MSLTKVTKPENEKNVAVIEFSIDNEKFKKAVDAVYYRKKSGITIPGFRKGKAPRHLIEKMYGAGFFYEDAINDLLPEAYTEALAESGLEPVSKPEFDIVSIDENGVAMSATLYTKPEVSLKSYKGYEVEKNVAPVTDEDIEAEIARVRERNGRVCEVTDRAAKEGDTVDIDYDGYLDGVAFEGGKAEHASLKLGSHQFIPGFEESVVGHSIGEAFDIDVTFPEEYGEPTLAGKAVVFKIVLHGIKETVLPELDDEFAKDVSEFDTLDEYKADVKAKLEEKNNKQAESEIERKLNDMIIENVEADIPEAMFESETENYVRDYDSRLRMQGLDLKTYLNFTKMTLDDLRAQFRPQAELQVKARLGLEKVAELESIAASDEDIEKEFENLSKAYNMEVEKIKQVVDAKDLAKDIAVQKAFDFIKANANITEK